MRVDVLREVADGGRSVPGVAAILEKREVTKDDVLRVAAASPKVKAVTILDGGCAGGDVCCEFYCEFKPSDAAALAEALARSNTVILMVSDGRDCNRGHWVAILEVEGDPEEAAKELAEALASRSDVRTAYTSEAIAETVAYYALRGLEES